MDSTLCLIIQIALILLKYVAISYSFMFCHVRRLAQIAPISTSQTCLLYKNTEQCQFDDQLQSYIFENQS